MTMVNQDTFLRMPTPEIAGLVRDNGPQVCVLAVNGTRRWFIMEHEAGGHDAEQAYLNAAGKRYIELCKLCFDHGLDTLLSPIFSSSHSARGGEYMQKIGAEGLALVATHPDYLAFYRDYQVRVRFYGDYRKHLAAPAYEHLREAFDELTRTTAANSRYRLFYGVFANDATESIAELSVRHFQATGQVPSREQLVELYYGEYVDPASLFIGFSKLRVYDYPLLNLGQENLYFTIAPSLYLSERQLRTILYDHICLRRVERADYDEMSEQNFHTMQNFYRANRELTLGIGTQHDGIWFPSTQAPASAQAPQGSRSPKRQFTKANTSSRIGRGEQR